MVKSSIIVYDTSVPSITSPPPPAAATFAKRGRQGGLGPLGSDEQLRPVDPAIMQAPKPSHPRRANRRPRTGKLKPEITTSLTNKPRSKMHCRPEVAVVK